MALSGLPETRARSASTNSGIGGGDCPGRIGPAAEVSLVAGYARWIRQRPVGGVAGSRAMGTAIEGKRNSGMKYCPITLWRYSWIASTSRAAAAGSPRKYSSSVRKLWYPRAVIPRPFPGLDGPGFIEGRCGAGRRHRASSGNHLAKPPEQQVGLVRLQSGDGFVLLFETARERFPEVRPGRARSIREVGNRVKLHVARLESALRTHEERFERGPDVPSRQ